MCAQKSRLYWPFRDPQTSSSFGDFPHFLKLWDREILRDAGKVSAEIDKTHAESEFEKYRIVQDRLFESDFDRVIKQIKDSNNRDTDEV